MSWIDKLSNDLIITCGDNKQYKPLWLKPQRSHEFNTAEFTFPNLTGSKVDRGTRKGRRFPLELYFIGADHLEETETFDLSVQDKRPIRIEHPYYGLIFVQPLDFNVDNTGDNVSKITMMVIETIIDDNPKSKTDPIDNIKITKVQLDTAAEQNITATITPTDINTMADTNQKAYNLSVPIIKLPEQAEAYYNAFNQASSAINTATASPILAMRATTAMLSYPANFQASAQTRFNLLSATFDDLRSTVIGVTSTSPKQIYQIHATALLSSMCVAVATPLAKDYTNSKSVINITDLLLSKYVQFIEDLDSVQTLNGGNTTSYIPSQDTLTMLDSLISFTIASLYNIALNSKVERSIITEKDTNIFLLTHRFYGLDPDDNNISELFQNNGWGLNHILQIKKGTKVIYYI
jgi:hypothetical protein